MEEFLKQNYFILTHSVEFLAAVTGLFVYNKYKFTAAKYFIWFLIYVAIGDFLGLYVYYIGEYNFLGFLKGTVFAWNYWWYTLFWQIGATLFFVFYFSKILETKIFSVVLKYTGLTFLLFSCIYIILNFDAFFTGYLAMIRVLATCIIFICVVFYFMEILNSNKILSFYNSIDFYISATIFIWTLITTPLVFFDIYNYNRDWNFTFLKWQIYLAVNLSMYLTYSIALIWCKTQNK